MSDHDKAQQILFALMRIHSSRAVVLLTPEKMLEEFGAEDVGFFYEKICGGNNA